MAGEWVQEGRGGDGVHRLDNGEGGSLKTKEEYVLRTGIYLLT